MTSRIAVRHAVLAAFAATMSAAGCARSIVGGGGEGGGDEGGAVPGTGQGDAVTTGAPGDGIGGAGAVSFRASELGSAGVEVHCGGEPCPPPDMLFVLVESNGTSCAAPASDVGSSAPGWFVSIGLPPHAQEVGVHAIDESFVVGGVFYDSGPSAMAVSSGGPGARGTIEILGIDETEVRFALSGLSTLYDSDGAYLAPRCVLAG